MKKRLILSLCMMMIFILAACQSNPDHMPKKKDLNIGVIGEIPEVDEEHIHFTGIEFKEIDDPVSSYDAVFITENYLEEATETKNIQRFKKSHQPTFFIGTKASYIPFIDIGQSVSYDDYAKRLGISNYEITGIIHVNDEIGYHTLTFNAPIEEEKLSVQQKHQMYSEVFEAISKNKLHKRDSISE